MTNQYIAIIPYEGDSKKRSISAPIMVIGASKSRNRFLKRLKISFKSTF